MGTSPIRHIHYKPELEELSVWFRESGRRYKFYGVPEPIYEAFRDAPSRGSFFNHHIRGRFESQLVAAPEPRRRYYG